MTSKLVPKNEVFIKKASDQEFRQICSYIQEFELDNRSLSSHQFTIALLNNKLAGFGRLRNHPDCIELCSLGVIPEYRRHGIGKAIVHRLIREASDPIYLVCIIPEFFIPFGFIIVNEYPAAIQDKLRYCTRELVVPETYVVLRLN